jgi:hypothetical protein
VMTKSKWAAIAIIGAGGAMVGVMFGWNLAPLTVELGHDHLVAIGAAAGVLLALGGCGLASEHAQARARNQKQLEMLRRLASLHAGGRGRNSKVSNANSDLKIAS